MIVVNPDKSKGPGTGANQRGPSFLLIYREASEINQAWLAATFSC
ncbi:MAG: hypothetical protein ACI9QL_000412, partial [Candidatus Omnitrophota bacterium]